MVEHLIHKGPDVHFTMSNRDTIPHLAIAEYIEGTCCYLMKNFIEAGCNLIARNSNGKTVLQTAIEHGYTSVVKTFTLAQCSLPPDILPIALQHRCTPQMIQLLVGRGANAHVTASGSDWDTLLQLVHTSYSAQQCQQVITILDASRRGMETYPSLRDETPIHVAKRPRLEVQTKSLFKISGLCA